jgi:hypothetical protein
LTIDLTKSKEKEEGLADAVKEVRKLFEKEKEVKEKVERSYRKC